MRFRDNIAVFAAIAGFAIIFSVGIITLVLQLAGHASPPIVTHPKVMP